ncbi:hypothetical protein [Devosia sp. CAU 1758]
MEASIENGTKALLKLDRELADVTIIADQRIDDMQRRIDDVAVSMIAPAVSRWRATCAPSSPPSTSLPISSAWANGQAVGAPLAQARGHQPAADLLRRDWVTINFYNRRNMLDADALVGMLFP